jgi:AraC-like DNA-binding protein
MDNHHHVNLTLIDINYHCARKEIIRLCVYLDSHINDQINLAKMQEISGLSPRSIQYAFRKYMGCRPLEWLRNERLRIAMIQLNSHHPKNINITSISYDLGFPNSSMFSKYFKKKYGENPSIVLARHKQKITINAF